MAYIEKLPKGKWRVHICKNGTRRSSTFELEDDAKRWANKIEGRIDASDKLALSIVPKRILDAMRSVPHSLPEVLEAAISAENMIGIYFLILNDEVIYVGQSGVDILARIAKHRREGRKFDSFAYMRCDIEDIDAMEEKYILAFMPEQNYSTGSSRKRVFNDPIPSKRGRKPTKAIPVWDRPGYVEVNESFPTESHPV